MVRSLPKGTYHIHSDLYPPTVSRFVHEIHSVLALILRSAPKVQGEVIYLHTYIDCTIDRCFSPVQYTFYFFCVVEVMASSSATFNIVSCALFRVPPTRAPTDIGVRCCATSRITRIAELLTHHSATDSWHPASPYSHSAKWLKRSPSPPPISSIVRIPCWS